MTQPDALALADELCKPLPGFLEPTLLERAAGNELRRLHQSNTDLLEALDTISGLSQAMLAQSMFAKRAHIAITKAERTTP
jgi:hypothetical protein